MMRTVVRGIDKLCMNFSTFSQRLKNVKKVNNNRSQNNNDIDNDVFNAYR